MGSHSISAVYAGDGNNNTATSSALTQTVNQASSGTTLASSLIPSTYGQNVTLTASVSGSNLTGTVAFKDNTSTLATVTPSSGTATYSTRLLAATSHSLTAAYSGDANNTASTSSAAAVTRWASR